VSDREVDEHQELLDLRECVRKMASRLVAISALEFNLRAQMHDFDAEGRARSDGRGEWKDVVCPRAYEVLDDFVTELGWILEGSENSAYLKNGS
jgi:hypothetical protein